MKRPTALPDVNVLLALAWPNHQFHAAAHRWFRAQTKAGWATCAVTQLGFVRLSANPAFTSAAVSPEEARRLLSQIVALPQHTFLEAMPPLTDTRLAQFFGRLAGHQQVTDTYLVACALNHRCRLATFDRRIAAIAGDSAIQLIGE